MNEILDTKMVPPEFKPFENIALSFSGGGFRAAAFSLGTLSYLNKIKYAERINLLNKVTYISSTSGGTITAAYYALSSSKPDFKFIDFYNSLKEFMNGDKLLSGALEILNKKELWPKTREEKTHNLINSFSIYYDQYLFNNATIGDINNHPHLNEVCFNATEFFKGQSFRMQFVFNNYLSQLVFGNFTIKIRQKHKAIINKLKLGDCLAASSCFPAGFEPIIFPNDFIYENLSLDEIQNSIVIMDPLINKESTLSDSEIKSIGLMDGGITDNQSIESMMTANGRRGNKNENFQLMLVCDVTSHYMDPYKPTDQQLKGFFNNLNLRNLKWIFFVLFLLAIPLPVVCSILGYKINQIALIATTSIGTISVIFWMLYFYIKSSLFSKKNIKEDSVLNLGNIFSIDVIDTLRSYLNNTKFGVLKYMIKSRLTSVLTLSNDVFLKWVRKLIYDNYYGEEGWKKFQKSIAIYDLRIKNESKITMNIDKWKQYFTNPALVDIEKMIPTTQIKETAERAFNIDTTLWFNKEQTKENKALNDIIATGQFTMCYNLISYIIDLKKLIEPIQTNPGIHNLLDYIHTQLIKDWLNFNVDPYFLIKEMETK